MKAIEKLKQTCPSRRADLNTMSLHIKETENEMRRLAFPSFMRKYKKYVLRWDAMARRLVVDCQGKFIDRPLIETKVEVREFLYPYLEEFVEAFLEENTRKTKLKE